MDEPQDHTPNRPFWDCKACGDPWPCVPGRAWLRAEAPNPTWLAMTMWHYFDLYAEDVNYRPVANSFRRFIDWQKWPVEPVVPPG